MDVYCDIIKDIDSSKGIEQIFDHDLTEEIVKNKHIFYLSTLKIRKNSLVYAFKKLSRRSISYTSVCKELKKIKKCYYLEKNKEEFLEKLFVCDIPMAESLPKSNESNESQTSPLLGEDLADFITLRKRIKRLIRDKTIARESKLCLDSGLGLGVNLFLSIF